MAYKVLNKKGAKILAAMGGGIIPRGGKNFSLGAADLSDKWLPRTDYILSRMNYLTRNGMLLLLIILNYLWPLIYLKKFSQITSLAEKEVCGLFEKIEASGSGFAALILLLKVLICPPFYGLEEVKNAIGYEEKFPINPDYVGIKD